MAEQEQVTKDGHLPRRLIRPRSNNKKMHVDDVVSAGSTGNDMELMGGDLEGIFDDDVPDGDAGEDGDLSIFGEEQPVEAARSTADLVRAADQTTGQEVEVEETEPRRLAPSPIMPDQATVEAHRVDHIPFASWCEHCMAGRGLGEHRGQGDGEHIVPIVGMAYFFITKEGFEREKDLKYGPTGRE